MAAPDAESLMRSRYTAFACERADYLQATWHASTRPATLDFDAGPNGSGWTCADTSPPTPTTPWSSLWPATVSLGAPCACTRPAVLCARRGAGSMSMETSMAELQAKTTPSASAICPGCYQ
eukprot:gene33378-biopygen32011